MGLSFDDLAGTTPAPNVAPQLEASASATTLSEAGGLGSPPDAVVLFSSAVVNLGGSGEAGQTITAFALRVDGLRDGDAERLLLDGSAIALGASASGSTADHGLSYGVEFSLAPDGSGSATLNVSSAAGLSAADFAALVNAIAYQNGNGDNPSAGIRTVTITSLSDSGGNQNGGSDSSAPTITSTVQVVPVNDGPLLGSLSAIALADSAAQDAFTATAASLSASDPEGQPLSYGLEGATDLSASGGVSFEGISYNLSKAGSYGTLYLNSSTGQYRFQPKSDWTLNALSSSGSDAFALSVSDGIATTSQALLVNFSGSAESPEQYVLVDDAAPVLSTEGQALWEQALTNASRILSDLLSRSDREALLQQVFGQAGTDPALFSAAANELLATLAGMGLRIEVDLRTDAELNGALAAYAAVGHTGSERIYVNGDKINSGALDLSTTVSALLEEFGHGMDRRLNGGVDSPGDEGQLFAAELTGVVLTAEQRALIAAQDDTATLTIEGVQVAVEESTYTGDATANTLSGSSGADVIQGLGGNDVITGGGGGDHIAGGAGADLITVGTGRDEIFNPANDAATLAFTSISGVANGFNISGFDSISNFSLGNGGDLLRVSPAGSSAGIAANATSNGSNSGYNLGLGNAVGNHRINNGIVEFATGGSFGANDANKISISSIQDVAAVTDYLRRNDIGSAYATAAFTTASFDANGFAGVRTYIYTQIGAGAPGSSSTAFGLVELRGVTATLLTTNAATTAAGALIISNNLSPYLETSTPPTLTGLNEDSGSPSGAVGTLVSTLTAFITSLDSGSTVQGIAITATNTTNGTLWYSTNNGSAWTQVGTVSASNSLLLLGNANSRLYYEPNSNYNGTVSDALAFRAWDNTAGTAATKVSTATNGVGTAYSAMSDNVAITVSAVNDAMTGSVTISNTTNGTRGITAARQGDVLQAANTLADVDGIGTISYQWLRAGAAISGATGATYALTQADVGSAITVRASQTDTGGTTENATSAATNAIVNINDAPTLDASQTPVLTALSEDSAAPSGAVGTLVSALTGGIADVDSAAVQGIAIIATNTTNATLWYSTNGGTNWTQVGVVSSTSALLLTSAARLYYQPAANYNGTTTDALTFRAWDTTSGTAGTKVNPGVGGGSTAFSTNSDTVAVTVNAVNDAMTGSVTISNSTSGTRGITAAQQGDVLTAANTLADVDGIGIVSYQWLRAGTAISGATGSTYTLTQADVGSAISVRASQTDGGGTTETAISSATNAIVNANDAPTAWIDRAKPRSIRCWTSPTPLGPFKTGERSGLF